jgi:hypothetical protein
MTNLPGDSCIFSCASSGQVGRALRIRTRAGFE